MSQSQLLEILKEPENREKGIDLETLVARLYPDAGPEFPKDSIRVMINRLRAKGVKITNKFIGRGNKAVYRLDDERHALELGLKYAREAHKLAGMTVALQGPLLDEDSLAEARRRVEEIAADITKIEGELNAVV